MLKIILTGTLIITTVIVVISCTPRKKKELIIGKEMGEAKKKDEEILNSKDFVKSPLKGQKYSDFNSGSTFQNPKQVDLDRNIIQLTKKYIELKEKERQNLRNSINSEDIYTIISFCERATVFGLREQNENIKHGLNALSMINAERCDYRDVLVAIGFVNHGLEKLQLDTYKLYSEAIKYANPRMKELLSAFQKRKAKDKAIEPMAGYTEYQFENGVGFIRCGYQEYNAKMDLPKIAFSIGTGIGNDEYRIFNDVVIAESLPLVWIKGQNENDVQELLKQSKGTVRLNKLLKEETKDWMSQMFLLHLIEFEDEIKVDKLITLLGKEGNDKFARIFGAEQNIFYLLVSRSTTIGIEDYETNQSLQRFRELIEREIKNEKSY